MNQQNCYRIVKTIKIQFNNQNPKSCKYLKKWGIRTPSKAGN